MTLKTRRGRRGRSRCAWRDSRAVAGFARPLLCVVLTCRTPSAPRLGLRGGNLGAASQSSWHRFFPAAPSVRVKRDTALPRPPPRGCVSRFGAASLEGTAAPSQAKPVPAAGHGATRLHLGPSPAACLPASPLVHQCFALRGGKKHQETSSCGVRRAGRVRAPST